MTDNIVNIERRVKKKIRARKHIFFASFPPEMQEFAVADFSNTFGYKIIEVINGGIEFKSTFDEMCIVNLKSGSINRVLMRVAKFKAMYFSEFKNLFSKTEWELYINPKFPVNFKVSCSGSRLYHTDRLKQECQKALASRFQFPGINEIVFEKGYQTIYVRIVDNHVQVSLDTTGDSLYMRGFKEHVNEAPLRENWAYVLLKLAEIEKYDSLIDPMCGSGTFSLETFLITNGILPGAGRKFAFFYQPVFSKKKFDYIKRTTGLSGKKMEILSYDFSEKSIEATKFNFSKAGLSVNPIRKDFFDGNDVIFKKPGLLVLNPPYGKRIKIDNVQKMYKRIFDNIAKNFENCGYIVLVPEAINFEKYCNDYTDVVKFSNGGIRVNAVIKNIFK